MNALRSAMILAGVTRMKTRRCHKPLPTLCNDTTLVIETNKRSNGRGMSGAAKKVQKVAHYHDGIAVTISGDVWGAEDMGNNYLRAI